MVEKIRSFEELRVWQESKDLAVLVYKYTKSFPKEEIYALTSQIRRAATSISANIAEGFGRSTKNDKQHFYTMAYGSLLEVKNFVLISKDLGYLSEDFMNKLLNQTEICKRLILASKRSLK